MPLFGIDVSNANGELDFDALKRGGVRFAFVRATVGDRTDRRFAENIEGFHRAGIPVGVYHELRADDMFTSVIEAEYFTSAIKPLKELIPLFAVCQVSEAVETNENVDAMIKTVASFCGMVVEAGFLPCIYSSRRFYGEIMGYCHSLSGVVTPERFLPLWESGASDGFMGCYDIFAARQYQLTGTIEGCKGVYGLDFGGEPIAELILKEKCGLGEDFVGYALEAEPSGELLIKLADRVCARRINPIRNPDYPKLATLIRWQCGLSAEETKCLLDYRYSEDALHSIYSAIVGKRLN